MFLLVSCKKKDDNKTKTDTKETKTAEVLPSTKTPINTQTEEPTPTISPYTPLSYIVPLEKRGRFGVINEKLEYIIISTDGVIFGNSCIAYPILIDEEEKVFSYYQDENKIMYLEFSDNELNITFKDSEEKINLKRVYFIEYDFNGGESEDYLSYFFYNEFIDLPTPTKDDSKFLGWYEDDALVSEINENRDYKLVAKYDTWLPWI